MARIITVFRLSFLASLSLITACAVSPPAFTVGGKITGLKSPIILENAGMQSMTLYSDGEFTFLGSNLRGTAFDVVVKQQPSGQTCTVSGGQGTFTDQNVKSVIVTCGLPLIIGSWNIENFGPSKASKASIMDELTQVMLHFDVIFIQEMPTATSTQPCANYSNQVPADCLLTRLNEVDRAGANGYSMLLSSTSMGAPPNNTAPEKYACYYRNSKVSVHSYFLADAAAPAIANSTTFTRPPFIVRLKAKAGNLDFYVISIHTTPDSVLTRSEIYLLPSIANYLTTTASVTDPDIMILGDFNSDVGGGGNYFTPLAGDWTTYFNNFTTAGYSNAIADGTDTTVITSNTYTYDRITLSPSLAARLQPGSAGAYYFDGRGTGATCTSGDTAALMNAIITAGCGSWLATCTCNGAASEVSDHYPVAVTLSY